MLDLRPGSSPPPAQVKTVWKEVRVLVPEAWHTALMEAAHEQTLPLSQLVRLVLRGFLLDRLPADQRRLLRGGDGG